MNEFKTKAGTILPLMNLKGKPYLQVAHRLVWFREEHPDASIKTSCVFQDEKRAVFSAEIYNGAGKLLATGTKQETVADFRDALEKSETGAVGRALAMCGYGTQFAPEFDEGDRLADSPITAAKFKGEAKTPQEQALTLAQVLVAQKVITKPAVLKLIGSTSESVTDAVMGLETDAAKQLLKTLEGKKNGK